MGIFSRLADAVIARAKRSPYRKGHLYHPDGSLYMGRYALFETRWLAARVHYIATADSDRHFHDHPWSFLSLVLRGGYVERRPAWIEPCFYAPAGPGKFPSEHGLITLRYAGSMAIRRATDRHLVSAVGRDTWTLFITGPVRQWWGFYTPHGKIHFVDYAQQHPESACVARIAGD